MGKKFNLSKEEETKQKISETKKQQGLKPVNIKKVIAINPITNEIINEFESSYEAGKFYNLNQSTISRRCTGVVKNKGGIYFYYK